MSARGVSAGTVRRRVAIVATGGTVANTPGGRLGVDDVVAELPELAELADLLTIDVTRVAGQDLTFDDLFTVARAVEQAAARDVVDGIVVTTGSNASADLAWFLHLTVGTAKPVVVTAAQRKRGTTSEDASRNLVDAVLVARSSAFATCGVLLVVNEMIHSARDVTKDVYARVDSWHSVDLGALGMVSAGRPVPYRQPTRRHSVDSEFLIGEDDGADALPRVEILSSYLDADPRLVRLIGDELDAAGVVVAAFPTGSATRAQERELDVLVERGIAVVIANRGRGGRVAPRSGGIVTADTLPDHKAQILLRLALQRTRDPIELQRIFDEY